MTCLTLVEVTASDGATTLYSFPGPSFLWRALGNGVSFGEYTAKLAQTHGSSPPSADAESEHPVPGNGSEYDENNDEPTARVKRGRGRPRKEQAAPEYPAPLPSMLSAILTAASVHGPVETNGDPADEGQARMAYLTAMNSLGPRPVAMFRIDRDPATLADLEMAAQIGRAYAISTEDAWVEDLRERCPQLPEPMLRAAAARARARGLVLAGSERAQFKERRLEQEAAAKANAERVAAQRKEAARIQTCTCAGERLVAVGVDPKSHPADPTIQWIVGLMKPAQVRFDPVTGLQDTPPQESKLHTEDGWPIFFFHAGRHILSPYESADLGSPRVRLLPSSFKFEMTVAERKKLMVRALPFELDRALASQRRVDQRPMTDDEMTSSRAVAEKGVDDMRAHLEQLAPRPYAQPSWTVGCIDGAFILEWLVRGLRCDPVVAHEALMAGLRTYARTASRDDLAISERVERGVNGKLPLEERKALLQANVERWEELSRQVAQGLERAFNGGPHVAISPGEVKAPGTVDRVVSTVKRAFRKEVA